MAESCGRANSAAARRLEKSCSGQQSRDKFLKRPRELIQNRAAASRAASVRARVHRDTGDVHLALICPRGRAMLTGELSGAAQ